MFRSLYARLALLLLAVVVLIGVLLSAILHVTLEDYHGEVAQTLQRDLARHIAGMSPLVSVSGVNMPAVDTLFHNAMAVNPSIEIYLLDDDGRVLAYVTEHGKIKREHVSLVPIHRFLKGDATFPLRGDDPRQTSGQQIFSVTPLAPAPGYLYVVLSGEQKETISTLISNGYVPRLAAMAAAAVLVFVFAAGLLAFNLLTRRLRRLDRRVKYFRSDGLLIPRAAPDKLPQGDEINHLEQTFDEMAARIGQQLQQLAAADRQRRELIANVSHDLRTPLTAMQGYFDTLRMQHQRLDAKTQQEYLEIAHRHSQHLSRLVDELFELAKLDSSEARPQWERFAITELAQDIVQKFRLAAEAKGVSIVVDTQTPALYVAADIGLLERVLQNLIDNALRHTPAGGTIYLRLRPHGAEARIEVSDNGDGIATQHLPFVFERFYRAQPDRPAGGSGLGLAIAQRILELHGGRISVDSRPGEGSTFYFYLPVNHAA